MAVTQDKPAPYAPASAVVNIIERHRNRGIPAPIDLETMGRLGVSDSLASRTLYALSSLDLIDEKGAPTEIFEGIRRAPEADYKSRLAAWLQLAYADALSFVDPNASEVEIRDAFRNYNPIGQQSRMVTLFMGLLVAAGMRDDRGSDRKKPSTAPTIRIRERTVREPPRKPVIEQPDSNKILFPEDDSLVSNTDPAILGLLRLLPRGGSSWTQNKRDRFLLAFQSVLDLCIPVVPDPDTNKTDKGNL